MTEDEAELLHNALEEFWTDWSRIVNDNLDKVPEHLRDDMAARMQEKATVWGVVR